MIFRIQYIVVTTLLFICTSPVLSAGNGSGYAWADKPKGQSYRPSAGYAFNSSAGAIQIRRRSAGTYQVTFAGLGGNGQAGGHVQVTAYGSGSEYCKVVGWNSGGADFITNVRCFAASGQPADTQYTVSVAWPPKSTLISAPGSGAIKRTIKPNGNVELIYPDGKVEELFKGGKNVTFPDGTTRLMRYSTQAPAAIPPSIPDQSELAWLNGHSESLLGIIKTLVDYDESAVQSYMEFETQNASLYEKIAKRSQTVQFLVTP